MFDQVDKVKEVLLEHGIESYNDDNDEVFILDSIQYISILVSLEEVFDIEIPDEYLITKNEYNILDFCEMVKAGMCTNNLK